MNKQLSIKLLASSLTLAFVATGCESIPSSSSSSQTNSEPVVDNTAAISASLGTHKTRYTADELVNDPIYQGTDIATSGLNGVAAPNVSVSDINYVPTVIIPKTTNNQLDRLDVSLLDDFINEISPNARHYPPNFKTPTDRYYATKKLESLESWLRPYAEDADASYEVLLRAAKLNGMARNLDLGSDYAVRGSTFIAKAIDRQPKSPEANFIYGMMLSEGGGFKEGKKYLTRAAAEGYKEAEQSLAQTELLTDKRSAALSRLKSLQRKYPEDTMIPKQIAIIESGKYYIWDLNVD